MLRKIKYAYLGLFFLLFAGLVNTSYSKTDIDELMKSAVGVWLFDEGKGKVAKDLSKEGNDGELVKNPTWVKGKFGQALEFNGKDNCVQTGEKLLDNLKEFTILLWVNTARSPLIVWAWLGKMTLRSLVLLIQQRLICGRLNQV